MREGRGKLYAPVKGRGTGNGQSEIELDRAFTLYHRGEDAHSGHLASPTVNTTPASRDHNKSSARATLFPEDRASLSTKLASTTDIRESKEPARQTPVVSQWGVGWKTPTLMVCSTALVSQLGSSMLAQYSSFLLGICIAILNFVAFRVLDRMDISRVPQSYVITASIILASLLA